MKTFKDLEFKPYPSTINPSDKLAKINFDNGYGVSVIFTNGYGVSVIFTNEYHILILQDGKWVHDSLLCKSKEEVTIIMQELQKLKRGDLDIQVLDALAEHNNTGKMVSQATIDEIQAINDYDSQQYEIGKFKEKLKEITLDNNWIEKLSDENLETLKEWLGE